MDEIWFVDRFDIGKRMTSSNKKPEVLLSQHFRHRAIVYDVITSQRVADLDEIW